MKYSIQQLRQMARVIMFNPDSQRSHELIWSLSFRTGLLPDQVLSRIQELAR